MSKIQIILAAISLVREFIAFLRSRNQTDETSRDQARALRKAIRSARLNKDTSEIERVLKTMV